MISAIRFQCTFRIGQGNTGPAHECGATFASLNQYVSHYHAAHDIRRPALPRAQRVTGQGPGQVNGQNERSGVL